MLTTLLPPTSGTARVAGYDVVQDGPKIRGLIGAALQEAALDPLLTGARPPAPAGDAAERPEASSAAHARRSSSIASGSSDAADRKVAGYSGGMKRRLDLALALVHSPRIIFLDEPTTGPRPAEPHRPLERGRTACAARRASRSS